MKSRRFSLAIAFVFCLSLVYVSVFLKTGTAQMDTQSVLFKGKIVGVQFVRLTQSTQEHGGRLEQAQVQKIGDRYFLGGKSADEGNMKGRMLWVPLDKVTSIAELEKTGDAFKASQKGMISGLRPADAQKP